jgi:hypothetical protein
MSCFTPASPLASTKPVMILSKTCWSSARQWAKEMVSVADLAGEPQVWERFQDRLGLPNGTDDIGYGHTSEQVDALRIDDPALLAEYHHEVTLATARYLQTVDEAELEREVDQRWDPPVTAGVRLVSIQGDCLQHLGQAAYVKGLLGSRPS